MKLISIVTPCYNEQDNVAELYERVKVVFAGAYAYEHIFIDNASSDKTAEILRQIAAVDKNVKVILNTRNFGHIRSPYYALMQARGDAAVLLACDFQEPPELIRDFIEKWEAGYKIVMAVKAGSEEGFPLFQIRQFYYWVINRFSEAELVKGFHGFGLYDKSVVDILKRIDDPYPYLRGLICDTGFQKAKIDFVQPRRKKGRTKNNFFTLFDLAMLGFTNYSKIPLRLATIMGFIFSLLSFLVAVVYLAYKLIFWNSFSVGMAPLVIGFFFLFSLQLFFIGVVGEYVGAILTQVLKRPLVFEKERINF